MFWPVVLCLVLLVGIWTIVWIRRRFWDRDDPSAVDQLMLTQVGDLRREGELSEEEYRSIKGRLVERLDTTTRSQDGDPPPDVHTSE